MQDVNTIVFL